MRFLFLFVILAAPAVAADYHTGAPVTQAMVFPQGGTYVRRAVLDLPQGNHRLFLPYTSEDGSAPGLTVSQGLTVTGVSIRRGGLQLPERYYSDAEAAVVLAVDAARARLNGHDDRIASVRARIEAADARRAFITALRPPTEEVPTAEELTALIGFVGSASASASDDILAAGAELRELVREREELAAELNAAEAARDAAGLPVAGTDLLVLDVVAAAPGPITVEVAARSFAMGWSFDYDIALDRGDAPAVTIARNVLIGQSTPFAWQGVRVSLGTANLNQQLEVTEVFPDQALIGVPEPAPTLQRSMAVEGVAFDQAMEEAEMAAAAPIGKMVTEGLAVRYEFPRAVNLAPGNDVVLALDRLSFDAETTIEAAPRSDRTAYLTAEFTNTSGAPVLGAAARFARDGQQVGQGFLPAIAPGEMVSLGFGPFDGILLDVAFDRNDTGDSGIIVSQNTRRQAVTFSVENVTGDTQTVRALYPLPFSEQEDLEVLVRARPAPDETDIDRKRGVSRWTLTLEPGQKAEVALEIDMEWPTDQVLNWNP